MQYNPAIMKKPIVIAANKIDASAYLEENPVEKLKEVYEPQGYKVYPISAVTGEGVKELLYAVLELLETVATEQVVYEQEYFPEQMLVTEDLPYTIALTEDTKGKQIFIVEGPKIDKMLSYTNLDSEKGFTFFQKWLRNTGILDNLKLNGINEGDTVRMYGHEFDYYSEDIDIDKEEENADE